jgi:hypothetical protein
MHIRGAAYFIICMKLENGELSLLTFLVRYSTISSVYNMIYVWEEKKDMFCKPFA